MDTHNDTVLITGGSAGIGRAFAEALYDRGAKVIITGRNETALRDITEARPGMAWYTLDIQDVEAIKAFAMRMTAEHPSLNAVVSNAGIMVVEDEIDLDIAEATVATNLLGPIRLTHALLPHLKAQIRASIVTVSSGLAFVPLAFTPTYSATKAAIHSWSQALRAQLRHSAVEVIEWAPPAVATDLMPGHADNPNSMPLDEFIAESVSLFEEGGHDEILVQRVGFLRGAEARGEYDQVFRLLNQIS